MGQRWEERERESERERDRERHDEREKVGPREIGWGGMRSGRPLAVTGRAPIAGVPDVVGWRDIIGSPILAR